MRLIPMDTELTPRPAQSILSVQDLQTHFFTEEGVVKAVDGADFDVWPGRTLGIVGESGCGKSVTTRSILGLVRHPGKVVGGRVLFRDYDSEGALVEVDLAGLDPHGRQIRAIRGNRIGLVFQEPMSAFSPVHTVGEQIAEMLRLHRRMNRREAHARAVELLDQVGVPLPQQRVNDYPHQLSGGLRQRAMIAMALACDPQLLIADEPTTALDVTTQAQIIALLKSLQDLRGMAIMLITHNLGLIAELADDVAVMYLGKVVEKGTVEEVFKAPKHPYTQALFRSMPGVGPSTRSRLPTIAGTIPNPLARPSGCPFHPRCEFFMPGICDGIAPSPHRVGPGQTVRCHLYPEDGQLAS
jgi:oligopeptide/dipeptide ABC transporter ATP-binding protein